MTKSPDMSMSVVDQIDARLDALGIELRDRVSTLREELAALPPQPVRLRPSFGEFEDPLAVAIADLGAAIGDLKSALRRNG